MFFVGWAVCGWSKWCYSHMGSQNRPQWTTGKQTFHLLAKVRNIGAGGPPGI